MLPTRTINRVMTKYVYGRGLIGEQTGSTFKTYHFDCRGSTVAITDANGNITDTFAYGTYGNLTSRTGTSKVIFLYNGRDGVVADDNGLYYMRARYYSPEMRRFVNADIIPGEISNAVTLNRYAYANGNPVSNVDPFGLWSWSSVLKKVAIGAAAIVVGAAVVAATAATGGAAAAFVGAAVVGVKAAAVSGAIGAAVGAGTSAISHRVSTGTWKGAEKAALDGAVEGFADGFMSGGVSFGVGMTAGRVLYKTGSTGLKIGNTAKPQYGKVTLGYANPNTGGGSLVTVSNNAGKRVIGIDADVQNYLHFNLPKNNIIGTVLHQKVEHIPFYIATGTLSGLMQINNNNTRK